MKIDKKKFCWRCGKPLVNGTYTVRRVGDQHVKLHKTCGHRFDEEQEPTAKESQRLLKIGAARFPDSDEDSR